MKQDILTISRVLRILARAGFDTSKLNLEDTISMSMLLVAITGKDIAKDICYVVKEHSDNLSDLDMIAQLFLNINRELSEFNSEIDRRKKHVIDLGLYVEDTEEELLKKIEENKDIYVFDMYLSSYANLKKNGIDPGYLSLYECMIISEEIACSDINKATMELLSIVDADNPSFCEQVRNTIKYANFYSFALDIHNDVDEMYKSTERKRDNK